MDSVIAELWRAVTEQRDDLGPRLVLGDALLERGDVRGELIHLQCDGNKTLRATDSDEPVTIYIDAAARTVDIADRAAALISEHWFDWLGPLGPLVDRDRSWFHEGMLFGIRPIGTAAAWRDLPDHPELAMVRKVRWHKLEGVFWDVHEADLHAYAAAIARIPHPPTWIDLDTLALIEALARRQTAWSVRGLRLKYWLEIWDIDPAWLGGIFPEVESLIIKYEPPAGGPVAQVGWLTVEPQPANPLARLGPGEQGGLIDLLEWARQAFPRLRTVAFAERWVQLRLSPDDEVFAARLRALGAVDV
jgi:uncharacterized protein (TIGR02996 family)